MVTSTEFGPTVGFIGLGAIGGPMAERIAQAGMSLVVHDLRTDAMSPFTGIARTAASAQEIGDLADIVIGCLPSLDAYRTMAGGTHGLVHGKRTKIYVHVGTTGEPLLLEIAEILNKNGIATLDAPMSGGVPRAKAGTLTVMAAGDSAVFEAVKPVFRSYASKIHHLSERPGAGQHMKMLNNMLSAANLALASEILLFGAKAGLKAEDMLDIINASTGQNSATLTKIPDHILSGRFDYGGGMQITTKDLSAFITEAERLGVPVPLSTHVRQAYKTAADMGFADDDMTRVIVPMERASGTSLRKTRET